jgi:hypothetical protein
MIGLMVVIMRPPTCGDVVSDAPGGTFVGRSDEGDTTFITPFITRVITSFVNPPTRTFVSASRS